MKTVFWLSAGFVGYAYLGYPVWLYVRSCLRVRSTQTAPIFPFVSIVMAAHNEDRTLPRKIQNIRELLYPAERLEVLIVSDGSTDTTNEILAESESSWLRPIILAKHVGKALALNAGVGAARGEIVIFADARQRIEPQAIEHLVSNFVDPTVGCVSGELMLGHPGDHSQPSGIGTYWNIEKKIRLWEAATGSVVGATGALYAVRRELAVNLPADLILDDVFIPMHAARQGARVIFDSRARVWDEWKPSPQQEFRRKVRTLAGNFQLLQLEPWLLTRQNPLRFELISHKLLRLFVPFALAAALVSSLLAHAPVYHLAAFVQLAFYGMAILPLLRLNLGLVGQLASLAMAFLLLNTAAVAALVSFVCGRKQLWVR